MDQILFPRFWKEKPALWFAQAEAVFALSGIISDSDKFDYIVTELPPGPADLVEDVILNPPPNDKYLRLKNEVIKQLSITYVEKEEMGNKTPSEFLQHLKKTADPRVPEETIKSLWLKSLPIHIKETVMIAASKTSMDVLSEMADRIYAISPGPLRQGTSDSNPCENFTECISKLNGQLENLSVQLVKLQQVIQCLTCFPCLKCKSQVDGNNNKCSMPSPQKLPTCWYHTNFGEKAIRCIAPCAFREKNSTQELFNATSF